MRSRRERIRVLQLTQDPSRVGRDAVANPYTVLLAESLPAERVEVSYFHWGRCLWQRFDLVHLHWPEHLAYFGSGAKLVVSRMILRLFLLRLRLQRVPVVRTVHNIRPHDAGTVRGERLVASLERLTTLWVVLNELTPTPDPERTVLVAHGHYRDWYRTDAASRPGLLLNFGLIKAYKGVDALVTAFRDVPADSGLSLRICGSPASDRDREALSALIGADPRIAFEPRFAATAELADLIGQAEAVVLPFRDIHNSGSALLALSLDRPVIVPASPTMELLASEFGERWVATYRGELTAETLRTTVARLRARASDPARVDMSGREWPLLGRQLADAYDIAMRIRDGIASDTGRGDGGKSRPQNRTPSAP